ncbi:MAG: hypothetical protein JSV32_07120 [Dehalococcoidia bacterium]|nr:MAG: hypothetical protein JSV32_07120 [Dehalococcoidia bacterium]
MKLWHVGKGDKDELPKSKTIPAQLGSYMVVDMKVSPNIVWDLKVALLPRPDNKDVYDVRLYHWQEPYEKGITIKNYRSLEEYPEFILYEGWWDKKHNTKHLEEKRRLAKVST